MVGLCLKVSVLGFIVLALAQALTPAKGEGDLMFICGGTFTNKFGETTHAQNQCLKYNPLAIVFEDSKWGSTSTMHTGRD
jgi:hypothetical protein